MESKYSQQTLKSESHIQALHHIQTKIKFHAEFFLICALVCLENILVLRHKGVVTDNLLINF